MVLEDRRDVLSVLDVLPISVDGFSPGDCAVPVKIVPSRTSRRRVTPSRSVSRFDRGTLREGVSRPFSVSARLVLDGRE